MTKDVCKLTGERHSTVDGVSWLYVVRGSRASDYGIPKRSPYSTHSTVASPRILSGRPVCLLLPILSDLIFYSIIHMVYFTVVLL